MRVAWPELIVLIVLTVTVVVGAELGVLVAALNWHVSDRIVLPGIFVAAFLDLWGVLRLIDWLFAGPARRRGLRVRF